ncbi:ubiquitin-like-conjugating enzyme ATG10 [Cololabis saira]|uniref:ubiquitin-like-conjugating enzyme ATG10 n=1 Tax=Cololabis saira TaxID=129043 RepID=UPI002AD37283|nr:ubiquitin-like-conjugating enzyme ATG10 [Cololabis saira]
MSSGVLDEDEFRFCCRRILQRSDQLGDGWSWEGVQGSEDGYLKKTVLTMVPTWKQEPGGSGSEPQPDPPGPDQDQDQSVSAAADLISDVTDDLISDEEDGSPPGTGGSSRVLRLEFHVLFSCSYSTPVLYWRASDLEGRSLTLEEMWSSTHPDFRRLQDGPLNTISQQEHPFLGQPFFFLHPCRTEEVMRRVLQVSLDQDRPVNYVVSWLSVVGPVVGLRVPLEFCSAPP